MDETRDGQDVRTGEMSEVGAQLFWLIEREFGWITQSVIERIVDLVEARFEVTEKPVVTAEELGRMARNASHKGSLVGAESRNDMVGLHLLAQLREAGLMIVRMEGGHR